MESILGDLFGELVACSFGIYGHPSDVIAKTWTDPLTRSGGCNTKGLEVGGEGGGCGIRHDDR